jgi:dihydropteroate synthase
VQLRSLPKQHLYCRHKTLDLFVPQVMGILNVTPDSFSDGGQYVQLETALKRAEQIVQQGGSIIDIGGESTRPGAAVVNSEQELARVIPVVEAIRQRFDVVISIDTSCPQVMRAAVQAGADIWNDVRALTRPDALQTAASLNIPVVLMHMRGEPGSMNQLAQYDDVTADVIRELDMRVDAAMAAGIQHQHIIIDPGFGFAKNAAHNLELLNHVWQLSDHYQFPLLVGLSRKRVLGEVLGGAPVGERVHAGLAAHLLGVQQGASIVRTHDVAATVQHLKLWQAVSHGGLL